MTAQTTSQVNLVRSNFNWRVFGILLGMVAFGLLALIPYGLTLSGQTFSPEMLPQLAIQFVGQLVLYCILIGAGLKLAPKVGLGAPWLENWTKGQRTAAKAMRLGSTILLGLVAGITMILLDVYVFAPPLAAQLEALGETVRPPAWQGFLAAFYGGIVEEIMTRFFLLTLLAWMGSKISRNIKGKTTPIVMWIAILIAGLIFGIGHLPTAQVMGIELTPLYVIRSIVLNGVGILYGWLYWKRGLESAMLAHFSTDIAVHVIGVLLLG